MSWDEHARNDPLLPRSASFGVGSSRSRLTAKASAVITAATRIICSGDESALHSACAASLSGCFLVGLLGVLNPFSLLSPLHVLASLYLVVFSAFAFALEVDVVIFAPLRQWSAFWMRGLTRHAGRGALYIMLGFLATGLGDPLSLLVGVVQIAAGGACLYLAQQGTAARGPRSTVDAPPMDPGSSGASSARVPADSAPRMAFRRRVLFGMTRMESAELVALCLELGLSLDTRARVAALAMLDPVHACTCASLMCTACIQVAALAMLDPDQEGMIDEESFMLWWSASSAAAARA